MQIFVVKKGSKPFSVAGVLSCHPSARQKKFHRPGMIVKLTKICKNFENNCKL